MAHVVADRFSSTAAHRLLVSDNEGAETPDGDGPRSLVTRPDPPPDEEPDLPGDGLGSTSFRWVACVGFCEHDLGPAVGMPFRDTRGQASRAPTACNATVRARRLSSYDDG